MDFDAYLDALASAAPTPGGGSAATLVGAMGAALCAMVARITLGNAKRAAVHPAAEAIAREADALRASFLAARSRDEEAFAAVIAAQGVPRAPPAECRNATGGLVWRLQFAGGRTRRMQRR
jgi:formiminotetrahydrofolate cyclodeaminase